jgi:hypothetical protein
MPPPPELDLALQATASRRPGYARYAAYYDGQHPLTFATQKFRNAFGSTFAAFSDNLCPAVVDAVADRLLLEGFGVEQGGDTLAAAAWALWLANRMDRRAGEVHLEALRSGDAYVIVWPDATGAPIFYPNGAAACTVHYDAEAPGRVLWASKQWWADDGHARLNLYYPDRIEKYRTPQPQKGHAWPTRATGFEPYTPDTDNAWPLPNVWGQVPVFHFANNSDVGTVGRSELQNVLPLQNALNKTVTDQLVAQEFVALPQRWATGLEVEVDETTGKPTVPFTPGVERIWAVANEQVRFGEFAQADLTQFLKAQDSLRAEIARVSGTPLHYLLLQTGDFPSGEAMRTAEARFLAKVRDRMASFGNAWEDAVSFGLRIQNALPDGARLSALWKDPTPRNEKEQAETETLKTGLGVSKKQALRELGYSDAQIDQMQTERGDEATNLGASLLANFDAGRGAGA